MVYGSIIGARDRLGDWLASPAGRYMLAWEQAQFDAAVADVFGYFALQCGMPEIDCLRENRMQSRIHACFKGDGAGDEGTSESTITTVTVGNFEELPFASQSLDLVALPHVLDLAQDPHQVLREVDRVLRPEGRLLVTGLNPISLWGVRQAIPGGLVRPYLPPAFRMIAPPRLRDWMRLLSFEPERGRYGCFRPPCRSARWLERTAFMERAGDRWWPVCGAVYFVSAVKRVRAMRLVGPAWKLSPVKGAAARVAAPRRAARVSDTCSRDSAAAD